LEKVPGLFLGKGAGFIFAEKVPGLFSASENKPGTFSSKQF